MWLLLSILLICSVIDHQVCVRAAGWSENEDFEEEWADQSTIQKDNMLDATSINSDPFNIIGNTEEERKNKLNQAAQPAKPQFEIDQIFNKKQKQPTYNQKISQESWTGPTSYQKCTISQTKTEIINTCNTKGVYVINAKEPIIAQEEGVFIPCTDPTCTQV